MVGKKVWQRIMRVHHFSHVLEPQRTKKNVVWELCPQKKIFYNTIFVSFSVELHILYCVIVKMSGYLRAHLSLYVFALNPKAISLEFI